MSKIVDASRLLSESGWFDQAWYLQQYQDVAMLQMPPVEHYLQYGAGMGRDPGPLFSTRFYLKANPDVARSGMNPLVHFLRHGRKERRAPRPPDGRSHAEAAMVAAAARPEEAPGRGERSTDLRGQSILLLPKPAFASPDGETGGPVITLPHSARTPLRAIPDVAVHAHIHYADLVEDIAYYLGNIPFAFALYVSVTSFEAEEKVRDVMSARVPQATLQLARVPNTGRDIAAFVAGFGQALSAHEIVAHIHSKRSPHNGAKADWRRQLLMNLMGTRGLVASIMRMFEDNPQLGMVFPEYHHSLRGQISWGTNFDICAALAGRMGITIDPAQMRLFPAGSMFWARASALQPLWDLDLDLSDFPPEAGQVDGTPAHAIERLFGEVVSATGHSMVQGRSDKPHNLAFYYPHKWPYPRERAESALTAIENYRSQRVTGSKPRVVVYTALAGNYESLLPYEQLDPAYDYVAFSDHPVNDCGFWQVRSVDYWNADPVRIARYVKSHPHKYFADYDYAVWVDANVVVRGDLARYVSRLIEHPEFAIGGIPHPARNCVYDESAAVVAAGKDAGGRVEAQMERYRKEGLPRNHGLIETNLMVVNLAHPASRQIMQAWWREMDRHSHRDQLSLNYVLWKEQQEWLPIMDERTSLRDSLDFAYFGHGRNSGYPSDVLAGPLGGETRGGFAFDVAPPLTTGADRPAVDIVVCVHNALGDVKRCLESVVAAKQSSDRIVIVDDASDQATARYLDSFARRGDTMLLRNPAPARGYCASANAGMRASTAKYVLLLNSDTVLPPRALAKMVELMESDDGIGIVGPLSNAASSQSIPHVKGSAAQTAVNALPPGMTAESMDEACEQWSASVFPSVPLVHGFCQLLRASMLEDIGGFDESAFPNGYGEENDLCMRATDAGYDLKIATHCFVYHVKSASYSDDARRLQLMKNGAAKLRELHSADRVERAIRTMDGNPFLVRMRDQAQCLYGREEANA
jgi:GT2 family glycosyltransferase